LVYLLPPTSLAKYRKGERPIYSLPSIASATGILTNHLTKSTKNRGRSARPSPPFPPLSPSFTLFHSPSRKKGKRNGQSRLLSSPPQLAFRFWLSSTPSHLFHSGKRLNWKRICFTSFPPPPSPPALDTWSISLFFPPLLLPLLARFIRGGWIEGLDQSLTGIISSFPPPFPFRTQIFFRERQKRSAKLFPFPLFSFDLVSFFFTFYKRERRILSSLPSPIYPGEGNSFPLS